jgi:hypothetical protein
MLHEKLYLSLFVGDSHSRFRSINSYQELRNLIMKTPNLKSKRFRLAISIGLLVGFFIGGLSYGKYNLFFTSGTAKILDYLPSYVKQDIVAQSNELNQLISTVQRTELSQSNPSAIKANRQRIADIYMDMSYTVSTSMNVKNRYNLTMDSFAKELSLGLKESASQTLAGQPLKEFHPQDMNFWRLGFSELTNAMSPEFKDKLLNQAKAANDLVEAIKRSEVNAASDLPNKKNHNENSRNNRSKLSEICVEMARILSDDLPSIQINNPRMVQKARTFINHLQETSIAVREAGSPLSELHPENTRYWEF